MEKNLVIDPDKIAVKSTDDIIHEAIQAVENINGRFFQTAAGEKLCMEGLLLLNAQSDGLYVGVWFLGDRIWCSSDDDRVVDENTGDVVGLEKHIEQQMMRIFDLLGQGFREYIHIHQSVEAKAK